MRVCACEHDLVQKSSAKKGKNDSSINILVYSRRCRDIVIFL